MSSSRPPYFFGLIGLVLPVKWLLGNGRGGGQNASCDFGGGGEAYHSQQAQSCFSLRLQNAFLRG